MLSYVVFKCKIALSNLITEILQFPVSFQNIRLNEEENPKQ